MLADNSLWKIEEQLWTGGADVYASRLDPACLMAFPSPTGILKDRETILQSLNGAPRWTEVEMSDRILARPRESIAVLAYHAKARRPGENAAYTAICTSTYVAREGGWRLVQHQQTPA